ncbi:MAG: NAD(P)/FAD-dependent oxidoreductase [Chloroflexota bacterium]
MSSEYQVIVIGAGPAGLATAYHLQQAGIPFKVLERSETVGDTWRSLYPSLRLNTSRWYSYLPGKKFPAHYPVFPTGEQYHAYLVDYAREFDLERHIHFNVEVTRVSREGDGTWRIESSEGVDRVPVVISATGRFGSPHMPQIDGLDAFEGEVLHGSAYNGSEPFLGKRVMVIGNGPTGVDIAPELGREPDMPPVLLSMRTGVMLRPRFLYGLPKHAWMILGDILPDAVGKPLVKYMNNIKFDGLDEVGIRTPAPEEESTAAGTRGAELIHAVRAGQVVCVPGPRRFFGRCVELDNGTTHEIDAVILATGYQPVLYKYLDAEVEVSDYFRWPVLDQTDFEKRDWEDPNYPSNRGRGVKGLPGLYIVGVFYQGKGAMYNFRVESRIAVEQATDYLAEHRPVMQGA